MRYLLIVLLLAGCVGRDNTHCKTFREWRGTEKDKIKTETSDENCRSTHIEPLF